ncbi:hypothetical protein PRIPAC_82199 [Pristionchus pacificus]|uniref:Uncharacterized protein n=1 Tax=Pristionchus pacificus TaxID=54126 RepID=A0A2A6C2Y5_PRIPA|nr:hypothetical protein PRIPAC_82199 [Pristionchus pacificus]|eukprot:PDM72391.1 hypothetical protein PRIPAC_38825 [Pristionchus pacificus]
MRSCTKTVKLALVDYYYPLIYKSRIGSYTGRSVEFFKLVGEYVKDLCIQFERYDSYRDANGTVPNLGGVLQAISDGKAFTELSCQQLEIGYMGMFDVSPPAGVDQLALYTGDRGSKTWSPISFFIPFSTSVLLLAIASVLLVEGVSAVMTKRSKLANKIMVALSSYCFTMGFALLFFAYNAGYQGMAIATKPTAILLYEEILDQFRSGAKQWYFRSVGVFDFSSLPGIPYQEEMDVQKLINIMCDSDGEVVASMYHVEYLELILAERPLGCRIVKLEVEPPTHPELTIAYRYFLADFYYFLFPKTIDRKLREQISFVSHSIFQSDHRESIFNRKALDVRSFPALDNTIPPVDWSALSFYSIGVIVLIWAVLCLVSIVVFIIELAHYRYVRFWMASLKRSFKQ